MTDRYWIRSGYTVRAQPEYLHDDLGDVIWQPDVYGDAARIAKRVGAPRIVDVGAGSGAKLVALHPEFEIIGVDYGANVDLSTTRYPFGTWRHHDLETSEPLPVSDDELEGAVVVCSDVIEHLKAPELLLEKLLAALDHAAAIVISTPERELWHGVRAAGPPRDPHHVREWSIREFGYLLGNAGFKHVSMGLTRSNDRTEDPHTMEALVAPTAEALESLVPVLIDRPMSPPRHPRTARWIRAAREIRFG